MRSEKMEYENDVALRDIKLGAAKERYKLLSKMTDQKIENLSELYRRFLYIQRSNATYYMIPTPLVDAFWLAHIGDFSEYIEDTTRIFGSPLSHYTSNISYKANVGDRVLHKQSFLRVYSEIFDENIEEIERVLMESEKFSDAHVASYVADMQEKFSHINEENRMFPNLHNRIKPY